MPRKSQDEQEINVLIGLRIQDIRIAMGLSRKELGEKLGVTQQQVQKYEKGSNTISSARLHQISIALSKPVDYFFEGIDTKNMDLLSNPWQRMSLEVLRNFSKIENPAHRDAVNLLVKSLSDITTKKPNDDLN